jgi:osmoprotectant transport system ATP-binding protein
MRTGRLVQFDTPFNLLSAPADEFVRHLLGAEDVFRLLSLVPVHEIMQPLDGADAAPVSIGGDEYARAALSAMIAAGVETATVVDGDEKAIGRVTMTQVMRAGRHEGAK